MSEQTTRPTKPLSDLVRGDFVHYTRTTDAPAGVVCEVKAVLPYRNGDGRQMVSGLLMPLAGGEPRHVRQFADTEFVMATDDDVAAARDQARRRQLQDDVVALQGLLSTLNVRPDPYMPDLSIPVVDGEVSRIAEALGLPQTDVGTTGVVKWTAPGDEDFGQRLVVRFWGTSTEPACDVKATLDDATRTVSADPDVEVYEPPADVTPEADQPWHFTFGSGLLYDGRYVVITGTRESARARMFEVFGRAWCDQYTRWEFTSNAALDGLIELPESEWPPVVPDEDDELATATPTQHVGR